MKAFFSTPTGPFNVTMDIKNPDLGSFLKNQREDVREGLCKKMQEIFKKSFINCRFEDECEKCGHLLEPGVSDIELCRNPNCSEGFPPKEEVIDLLREFPFKNGEPAKDWLNRIAVAWRTKNNKPNQKEKYTPPKKVDPKLPHKALKNLKGRMR